MEQSDEWDEIMGKVAEQDFQEDELTYIQNLSGREMNEIEKYRCDYSGESGIKGTEKQKYY